MYILMIVVREREKTTTTENTHESRQYMELVQLSKNCN